MPRAGGRLCIVVGVTEAPSPGAGSRYRPDIEGLRAVAIGAVLLYHAGVPLAPGGFVGVDVFFVISGYLITGLLWRERVGAGAVSLRSFYARRIRRLLPAAVLVLVFTAVVGRAVLPVMEWEQASRDIAAAALYVSNLAFAAQATDYLAADVTASPVLHFWSLSVEEQFYLVWPLVLIGATAAVARAPRRAAVGALVLLAVASLSLSVRLTDTDQPWAFFGSAARGWQFAAGGLLYLLRTARPGPEPAPLGRAAAEVLGILGATGIAASIVLLSDQVPYPGWPALLPTLGTVALIGAGPGSWVGRMLGTAGPRAVGRVSYSWYLWHWPFVVFALALGGPLPWPALVGVVAASWLPAFLAYRYVESPLRRPSALMPTPAAAYRFAAVGTLGAVGLATLVLPWSAGQTPVTVQSDPMPDTAVALVVQPGAPMSPADARADIPVIYDDDCHLSAGVRRSPPCVFGAVDGDRTVVLFGDSHAAQWFPAVQRIADQRGWRLLTRTKSGCPASDVVVWNESLKRRYRECEAWRESVLTELAASPADLIIVAEYRRGYVREQAAGGWDGPTQAQWQRGRSAVLSALRRTGADVVFLQDTPVMPFDPPECLAENPDDPTLCAAPRASAADVEAPTEVPVIDLTDAFCSKATCPAVRWGHVIYRDDSHMTARFARALSPVLGARLAAAAPAPRR